MEVHKTYTCRSSGTCKSSNNAGVLCLTAQQVIDLFNYLIDNIYIQVCSVVLRQCIGIPMGTDCAPLIADLFLFSFEFDFMKGLICKDLAAARKFSNTFRYIDDLLVLNNPQFVKSIGKIYPPELESKRTTERPITCSYLDLNISISGHRFHTDLYDKRDAFHFHIVNFPHMVSNTPTKPAYDVFISQLIRYLRICGNYQQFKTRSTKLTSRLLKQGFDYTRLQNTFRKFLQRNPIVLRKYQVSHKNILVECISFPLSVVPSLCRHISSR